MNSSFATAMNAETAISNRQRNPSRRAASSSRSRGIFGPAPVLANVIPDSVFGRNEMGETIGIRTKMRVPGEPRYTSLTAKFNFKR